MTLNRRLETVKPEAPHAHTPDDASAPSCRAASRSVPPWFRRAAPNRIQFRARLLWVDPCAPSGRREEIVRFTDPRRLLKLLQRVQEAPARPLLSACLEAMTLPRWEPVPLEFIQWRAAQRDRRDEVKRVLTRRAGTTR